MTRQRRAPYRAMAIVIATAPAFLVWPVGPAPAYPSTSRFELDVKPLPGLDGSVGHLEARRRGRGAPGRSD